MLDRFYGIQICVKVINETNISIHLHRCHTITPHEI